MSFSPISFKAASFCPASFCGVDDGIQPQPGPGDTGDAFYVIGQMPRKERPKPIFQRRQQVEALLEEAMSPEQPASLPAVEERPAPVYASPALAMATPVVVPKEPVKEYKPYGEGEQPWHLTPVGLTILAMGAQTLMYGETN